MYYAVFGSLLGVYIYLCHTTHSSYSQIWGVWSLKCFLWWYCTEFENGPNQDQISVKSIRGRVVASSLFWDTRSTTAPRKHALFVCQSCLYRHTRFSQSTPKHRCLAKICALDSCCILCPHPSPAVWGTRHPEHSVGCFYYRVWK